MKKIDWKKQIPTIAVLAIVTISFFLGVFIRDMQWKDAIEEWNEEQMEQPASDYENHLVSATTTIQIYNKAPDLLLDFSTAERTLTIHGECSDVMADTITGYVCWEEETETAVIIPIERNITGDIWAKGWFNISHTYMVEDEHYVATILLYDEDGGETQTEVYIDIQQGRIHSVDYEEVYRINDPDLPVEI